LDIQIDLPPGEQEECFDYKAVINIPMKPVIDGHPALNNKVLQGMMEFFNRVICTCP